MTAESTTQLKIRMWTVQSNDQGPYSPNILNPLPDDKFLDWSKLKAFADEKINVTQKLNFVLGSRENIMGNGENAGDHFPQCFQKPLFSE